MLRAAPGDRPTPDFVLSSVADIRPDVLPVTPLPTEASHVVLRRNTDTASRVEPHGLASTSTSSYQLVMRGDEVGEEDYSEDNTTTTVNRPRLRSGGRQTQYVCMYHRLVWHVPRMYFVHLRANMLCSKFDRRKPLILEIDKRIQETRQLTWRKYCQSPDSVCKSSLHCRPVSPYSRIENFPQQTCSKFDYRIFWLTATLQCELT